MNNGIDYEKLLDSAIDRIHTLGVAKIINVDNRLGFADIQVLNIFKTKKVYKDIAPLKKIPILPLSYSSTFEEGIEYSVNDKVLIAWFSDEGRGALNSIKIVKNIIFKRKFNINECVILRGLKNTTKIPMEETGRYIKNKKTGDLFLMKSNGGFEITSKTPAIFNCGVIIKEGLEVEKNIIADTVLGSKGVATDKVDLDLHIHEATKPGTPGVDFSGKPFSAMKEADRVED